MSLIGSKAQGAASAAIAKGAARRSIHKRVAEEVRKCRADFFYFAGNYLYFQDRYGAHRTFSPNDEQLVLLHHLEESGQVLNLKARKLGMSSLLCFYATWLAMFHGTKCALLAHDDASVKNLVRTKFRYALDHLPSFLRGGEFMVREDNMETGLVFASGGSLRVSKNEGAAFRGGDIGFLHISEFAFLSNPDKTFAAALNACLPGSMKVLETTANGLGKTHELWNGDGVAWRRVFFPWMTGPEYRIQGSADRLRAQVAQIQNPDNLDKFNSYCRRFELDVGQSLWVLGKLSENNFDWVNFHREYPATPDLAFSMSKGRVFTLSFNVGLPRSGTLEFSEPSSATRTTMGVDTASGYEDGDYHAFAVMEGSREKPILRATGYYRCPIDEWGKRVYDVGMRWNSLVVCETASSGVATLDFLRGAGFPNLYRRRQFDKTGSTSIERLGFATTESSRSVLIRGLMALFAGDKPLIDSPPCPRLQWEINNFRYNEDHKDNRPEHAPGTHDDLLFAVALAYFGLDPEAFSQHTVALRRRPKTEVEEMLWEVRNGRPYDPLEVFDDDTEEVVLRNNRLRDRVEDDESLFVLPMLGGST